MLLQWWQGEGGSTVEKNTGKAGWVEEERKGLEEYFKYFIFKKFPVKKHSSCAFLWVRDTICGASG